MNAREFAEQNAEAIRFTVARLTDSGNGGPHRRRGDGMRPDYVAAIEKAREIQAAEGTKYLRMRLEDAVPLIVDAALDRQRREERKEAVTEPTPTELIHELRARLDLPNYARPESPKQVWEETLREVDALRGLAR